MEGDTREDEAEDHAWGGPDHDFAAAYDVDVLERDEREDEVRPGDDEADSRGLVEADLLEERGWQASASAYNPGIILHSLPTTIVHELCCKKFNVAATLGRGEALTVLKPHSCWNACIPQPTTETDAYVSFSCFAGGVIYILRALRLMGSMRMSLTRCSSVVEFVISTLCFTAAAKVLTFRSTCSGVAYA